MHMCQPVIVGINHSIKSAMHEKWEDCMLDGKDIVNEVAKESSCQLVAVWHVLVYSDIPGQMGRNALMKMRFEFFRLY